MSQNFNFDFGRNLSDKNLETKKKLKRSEIFPSSDSFYGSYFKIFKKLRKNQAENIFSRFYSDKKTERNVKEGEKYFGAFVNSSHIEEVRKCGIPFMIPKLKMNHEFNEDLVYKQNLKKYLNTSIYEEDEEMEISEKFSYDDKRETYEDKIQKYSENSKKKPRDNKMLQCLYNLIPLENLGDAESLNKIGKEIDKHQYHDFNFTSDFTKIIKSIPQKILANSNTLSNHLYTSIQFEEFLFFNPLKIINYDKTLQKNFQNLIYKLNPPIDLESFFPHLIFLIQGIPSKLFQFNFFTMSFELNDPNFRFITTTPQSSKNFISFFIEFGNKMFLIQAIFENFLYKNEKTPFILKNFYHQVNLIFIKINEKIILFKSELLKNKINLIGLFRKIEKYSDIVNLIFYILNLPNAVEEYLQKEKLRNSLEQFINFYQDLNLSLKSHNLLNFLYNYCISSLSKKTKNYALMKDLLLSGLKSYLNFIVYLIFSNELIDMSNEYFMTRSDKYISYNPNYPITTNEYFSLDNSKVPVFLQEYTKIILNNSILITLIRKHEINYFTVCNFKINEILDYVQNMNFSNFSSKNLVNNQIKNFNLFKEKIFNKKVELMFTINEKILAMIELSKNQAHLERLNQIKMLKNYMLLREEFNKLQKEREIEKKKKYLNEIQSQILLKKQRIDNEIEKLKYEKMAELLEKEEKEKLKREILENLKKKYKQIKEQDNEIQNLKSDNPFMIWRNRREKIKLKRYEIFGKLYDVENNFENSHTYEANNIHSVIERKPVHNFHFINIEKNNDKDKISVIEKASNFNNILLKMNESFATDLFKSNNNNNNINNNLLDEKDKKSHRFMKSYDENISIKPKGSHLQNSFSSVSDLDIKDSMNIITSENINMSGFVNPSNQIEEINDLQDDIQTLPRFYIKNIMRNEILNPIIETAIDIASNPALTYNNQNNIKQTVQNLSMANLIIKKTNKEVDLEVFEILNQIQVMIEEKESEDKAEKTYTSTNLQNDYYANNNNKESVEVPIQVILQEFFYDLIINQYKLTNNCFVLMVKHKFSLFQHLENVKKVYLCENGDLILNFIESVIDFKSKLTRLFK